MHQSCEHIARFIVFLLDVFFDIVEKAYVTSLIALNNFRREFVHHDEVVVLVKYSSSYIHSDS